MPNKKIEHTNRDRIHDLLYTYQKRPDSEKVLTKSALRDLLHDPFLVLACDILHDDHVFKQEALIVSDAFESVTNGMYDPHALQQLDRIDAESIFFPWKHMIAALHAMYAGNEKEFEEALSHIHPSSLLAKLVPLLKHITGLVPLGRELLSFEKQFACLVIDNNMYIHSAVEELVEALTQGFDDVFVSTALLLVRDLLKRDAEVAVWVAEWCAVSLLGKRFVQEEFARGLRTLLGTEATNRIMHDARKLQEPQPKAAQLEFCFSDDAIEKPACVDLEVDVSTEPDTAELRSMISHLKPQYRYVGPGAWLKVLREYAVQKG